MVRTDASLQKLDKFLHQPQKTTTSKAELQSKISHDILLSKSTDLTSVFEIKKSLVDSCSGEVRDVLVNHTFVGCVDRGLVSSLIG